MFCKGIVFLLLHVTVQSFLVCEPDFCDQVKCPDLTDCEDTNGRVKEKAGYCGCCDACITQLEHGEKCIGVPILTNSPLTEECSEDEGLVCDPATWTCLLPEEIESRSHHFRTKRARMRRFSILSPAKKCIPSENVSCEPINVFSAKQCNNKTCRCVSPTGIDLGYKTPKSEAEDMKCICARKAYNPRHLLGLTIICDKKGNFEPLQCRGSGCSCVDPLTGKRIGKSVHIGTAIKC